MRRYKITVSPKNKAAGMTEAFANAYVTAGKQYDFIGAYMAMLNAAATEKKGVA